MSFGVLAAIPVLNWRLKSWSWPWLATPVWVVEV